MKNNTTKAHNDELITINKMKETQVLMSEKYACLTIAMIALQSLNEYLWIRIRKIMNQTSIEEQYANNK